MAQESNPRFFSREFSEILVEFAVKYPFCLHRRISIYHLGERCENLSSLASNLCYPSNNLRNPPVNTVERKSFRRGAPLLLLLLLVVEERKGKKTKNHGLSRVSCSSELASLMRRAWQAASLWPTDCGNTWKSFFFWYTFFPPLEDEEDVIYVGQPLKTCWRT